MAAAEEQVRVGTHVVVAIHDDADGGVCSDGERLVAPTERLPRPRKGGLVLARVNCYDVTHVSRAVVDMAHVAESAVVMSHCGERRWLQMPVTA